MPQRRLSSRKTPRQERSRATVDAIVEAAADILVRHGYSRLTTNRIADRAGVNIASVYQYFPGKEAIVAELRRRHLAEQHEAARAAVAAVRGTGLKATVKALVSVGIAVHAVAPRLHHVLTEELPARKSRTPKDDPLVEEIRALIDEAAAGVPDKELAFWMVDTVAYAVIHRASVERPADLSSPLLADELVTMLVRYLQRI
jgi:AcrR family transcriptional regulator